MIPRRLAAAALTSGLAVASLGVGGCGAARPLPVVAPAAAVDAAAADEPPPTTPETAGAPLAPATASTVAAPTGPRPTAVAAPGCDINYTPCVPAASDVDCRDAPDQDGPRFVVGPIRITGDDVYQLDGAERDGVACEGSGR